MKKALLFLWQFPQNLLGLAVIAVTGAKKIEYKESVRDYSGYVARRLNKSWSAVSLGEYRIFKTVKHLEWNNCRMHEEGHSKQSRRLGWLYLIIIGLPSILGNIYDRIFHGKWSVLDRQKWYYSLPWEAQADKMGGVARCL